MSGQTARTVGASVVALIGIGMAVSALIPTRSDRTDAPKPRIVASDGSTPARESRRAPAPSVPAVWSEQGPASPEAFIQTGSKRQAADAAATLAASINRLQPDRPNGPGEAAAGFLRAGFDDDHSMSEAIASLGGVEHPASPVLEAILATMLEGASIDTANIAIDPAPEEPEPARGIRMNRNRSRNADADADGNETTAETITLSSSFQDHFPHAVGEDARGELVRVSIPMRTAKADGDQSDLRLSLVLRLTADTTIWQPASMEIVSRNVELMNDLMGALRKTSSRATEADKAPAGGG